MFASLQPLVEKIISEWFGRCGRSRVSRETRQKADAAWVAVEKSAPVVEAEPDGHTGNSVLLNRFRRFQRQGSKARACPDVVVITESTEFARHSGFRSVTKSSWVAMPLSTLFEEHHSGVVHVITPCDPSSVRSQRDSMSSSESRFASVVEMEENGGDRQQQRNGPQRSVLNVCGVLRVEIPKPSQKAIASAVLMPSIICLVWFSPVQATILLVAIAAFVGNYEFAWIAFRIQTRLQATYRHYESRIDPRKVHDRSPAHFPLVSVALQRALQDHQGSVVAVIPAITPEQQTFEYPNVNPRECATTNLARKLFRGNRYAAALVFGLPLAGLLVAFDLYVVEGFILANALPATELNSNHSFRWIYLLSTRYAASISALLTPSWNCAVLMVFQVGVFSVMSSQTLLCPMGNFVCPAAASTIPNSMSMFSVCMLATAGIVFFTILSSTDAIETVVKVTLSIVGFVLVYGFALVVLCLVDDVAVLACRGFLVALLLLVWVGNCSACCWESVRESVPRLQLSSSPGEVSPRSDVEGMVVAIGSCAVVMTVLTQVVVLPRGSVGVHIGLAIGAAIFNKMGDLVLCMLKDAAGVKQSGQVLIRDLGGVLDQATPLSFAALVFAQYAAQL